MDMPDLTRTLEELERLGRKRSEMMNMGPARVAVVADGAKLLREVVLDLMKYGACPVGCQRYGYGPNHPGNAPKCTCGHLEARERWRLPPAPAQPASGAETEGT